MDIYGVTFLIIGVIFVLGLIAVGATPTDKELYVKKIKVCAKCKFCKNATDKEGRPILGCFHPALANHGFMNVITGELRGIPCVDARKGYAGEDSFCGVSGRNFREIQEELPKVETTNEGEKS